MNWWVLRRRVHPSWLIAIFCCGFLVGVFVSGGKVPSFFYSVTWFVCGLILALIVFARRYIYLVPFMVMAGVIIGLWRGSVSEADLLVTKQLVGHEVTISGEVKEDVDTNSRGQLTLRLSKIEFDGEALPGNIWVTTENKADIKRSDIVTVKGLVGSGFGSFVGSMYSADLLAIARPEPGDTARVLRDWFADKVRNVIPEPQASLGIGFLVGQKRGLPDDLVSALQIVGLTHVVVASGYNLTILVRLARRLFEKISKYLSALAASLMIVAFVVVTGMSPSMSRAGLVAGLSLAAWYYGRKFHPLVLLPLAAAITVMVNPTYIWGDLGWQLSFTAFAGVMVLAPLLQAYFFHDRKDNPIRRIFIETLSAFIMTAPVIMYGFGQISNVAIIANILVLIFVPLAMLFTFVAGLAAILVPAVATYLGLPANWLLSYMTSAADYLSKLPWAVREVEITPAIIGLIYILIIGVIYYMWKVTKYDLRDSNIIE